jgi:chaperonin cofactor prefoldin
VTAILSVAGAKLAVRLRASKDLRSPEEYHHEIQRLQEEIKALALRREREAAELQGRERIMNAYPKAGGMPAAHVEQRLQNLWRIRDERLRAQEEVCQRRIAELRRELKERFGGP